MSLLTKSFGLLSLLPLWLSFTLLGCEPSQEIERAGGSSAILTSPFDEASGNIETFNAALTLDASDGTITLSVSQDLIISEVILFSLAEQPDPTDFTTEGDEVVLGKLPTSSDSATENEKKLRFRAELRAKKSSQNYICRTENLGLQMPQGLMRCKGE